ncbi:short-chain collagen C4-like, partial [Saccostrea cucullata]|uniref:short-chain collagen C4-like n=1 Tax=Saccostrea cuccullata TaxID=36930 RepID=UPI002ED2B545
VEIGNREVVYTRWGKSMCPSHAKLVYSGYTAGGHYTHPGAAVDPLCLPTDPEWGIYKDGFDGHKGLVYGTEYETASFKENIYFNALHDHDVPCAVCLAQNKSVLKMFPARKSCYEGWSLEYEGYLMAGNYRHPAGKTYTCVDKKPETIHGGHANNDGYLFYFVEAVCGSLKCPPYVQGRELTCAVCSKM